MITQATPDVEICKTQKTQPTNKKEATPAAETHPTRHSIKKRHTNER